MPTLIKFIFVICNIALVNTFPKEKMRGVAIKLRKQLPLVESLDDIDDMRQPVHYYVCEEENCEKEYLWCATQVKWDCREIYPGILYKKSYCYQRGIKDCKKRRSDCEANNNFGEAC